MPRKPRKPQKITEKSKLFYEEDLTYRIRGCVYEVYRELGAGFLEQVYEAALMKEFALQGIDAAKQVPFDVVYKKMVVGKYIADIVVENKVILELKAQEKISGAHEAQLINYLKASGLRVGLLVNFCYPKAVIKRIVN